MKNIISEIELKYCPGKIYSGNKKITNSQIAFDFLLNNWENDTIELFEEFKVLLLNRANEVLGIYTLSRGGIAGTVVDIKLLFAVILKSASSSVILVHNHPSGNLKPSKADNDLYNKIKVAAEYLDVSVLDNMIISKNGYLSFADEKLL
ncbi:JAB domain-containing protein [Psychroserpens sp. XS_ASV72]|uniref:JAB domain-containing protein n=1 Tax=Psychroserpens sp. XS_ASV72 TaxID=3241293 RepID=UPI0035138911